LNLYIYTCHRPNTSHLPFTTRFRSPSRPAPGQRADGVLRPEDGTARVSAGCCRSPPDRVLLVSRERGNLRGRGGGPRRPSGQVRSEEHTSELQSRGHLVCRILLEKK